VGACQPGHRALSCAAVTVNNFTSDRWAVYRLAPVWHERLGSTEMVRSPQPISYVTAPDAATAHREAERKFPMFELEVERDPG